MVTARERERSASEAEPPLKAVAESPLSPRRSTNIAESSREPEGRLSTAEQESEQREAILQRIHELEAENAPAEKREAAKARKKTLKDLRAVLDDTSQSDERKVAWLQSKVVELVSLQAKLENQLIPAHKRESQARKEKDEATAELQKTREVNQKLQELSRLLQQQNKDIVERARDIQDQDQKNLKAYEAEVAKTLQLINEKIQEEKVNREQQEQDNEQLRTRLDELDAKWAAREDIFAKQVDTKDQEVALWKERCERQEEMLAGAMERETALQGHLEGARASVGEVGARASVAMEQHLAKYADYQDAITKSNELMKQLQEADKTKEATIKALVKGKKLLEKQLQQTAQVSNESTAALKTAVQQNKTLAGLTVEVLPEQ
ncbi:hypothetical protein WJX73_002110 [Symbiochloris irregularis]|uniref:Uncharacterized protein n=1 Tax=Symbiochloris irregularis TaxID=706552 RepID=A0AAW1P697_9CHLO